MSDSTLRLHLHIRPEADWFNAHEHEGGHYPNDHAHDARATWPRDLVATPDSWRDEAEMLRSRVAELKEKAKQVLWRLTGTGLETDDAVRKLAAVLIGEGEGMSDRQELIERLRREAYAPYGTLWYEKVADALESAEAEIQRLENYMHTYGLVWRLQVLENLARSESRTIHFEYGHSGTFEDCPMERCTATRDVLAQTEEKRMGLPSPRDRRCCVGPSGGTK